LSTAKQTQERSNEDVVELRIAGHPVSLSFAREPDISAARRVRNCLLDSFLRQDTAKHGTA
jgi:hypothetical protein